MTISRPAEGQQPAVRTCPCEPPRPSRDPRREGWCSACLGKLPPPLPDEVERLFEQLGEVLESAGYKSRDLPAPEFDAYRQHSLARAWEGQRLYGDRWRGTPMVPELLEELPDVANYTAGEIAKNGTHPRLMQGMMLAFLSYAEFRQYEAEQRHGDGD